MNTTRLSAFTFVILLVSSALFLDNAWRLPLDIDPGYYSALKLQTSSFAPSSFEPTKSQLVYASLILTFSGFVSLICSTRRWLSFLVALAAITSTALTLSQSYEPLNGAASFDLDRIMSAEAAAISAVPGLKVLASPAEDAQPIAIIPLNETFSVVTESNGWAKLIISGRRVGWAKSKEIRFL